MPRNNIYINFVHNDVRKRKKQKAIIIETIAATAVVMVLVLMIFQHPKSTPYSNITSNAKEVTLPFKTNAKTVQNMSVKSNTDYLKTPIEEYIEDFQKQSALIGGKAFQNGNEKNTLALSINARYASACDAIIAPLKSFFSSTQGEKQRWQNTILTKKTSSIYEFSAQQTSATNLQKIFGQLNQKEKTITFNITSEGTFKQYASIRKTKTGFVALVFSIDTTLKGLTGMVVDEQSLRVFQNITFQKAQLENLTKLETQQTWQEFSKFANQTLEFYDGKLYLNKIELTNAN